MLRKIRTVLAITLALCMVFSFTALAADSGYRGVVTIVHTNDVHSNVAVEPYVKGYVDALRAEGKDVVLVSGGDAFKGTAFASMTDGLDVATVMNMTGYDIFTMGNHEQLLGIEKFSKVVEKVEFPVLAANISKEWHDAIPAVKDYVIKEFGGTKIAFIGITYPMFGDEDPYGKIISSAEKAKADAQAEGASIFVAITHLGVKDAAEAVRSTYLAEKCPWLTAIIDAHCHTAHQQGLLQGDVLIAETGEYGNNIGVVELTFESGAVKSVTAKLIPIKGKEAESGITPDKEIQDFIDTVNAKSADYLNEVVATTPVDLDGVRNFSRTQETNLGDIVTDAMRKAAKTDFAFVLGPYLRVDIPAGDITRDLLMRTLYENVDICVVEASGQEIFKYMSLYPLSMYPKENTWFTHVSGLMVEFNPELGNNVISVRLADGSDLDMDATYTCAVRSDNVGTIFAGKAYTMGAGTICEVVADYFNSGITVSREVAGRIKAVETGFSDVIGHWAESSINELLTLRAATGYSDGTFHPKSALTLDDFISIIKTAFKLTDEDAAAIFPEGGSDEALARKDAALYLMRLIEQKGITLTQGIAQAFTDLEGVSAEAAKAISALQSASLINGVGGGRFAPNSSLSRAEIAVLVDRVLDAAAVVEAAA